MDAIDEIPSGSILHGRYETLSPLNHGSFGQVYLARDLHDHDQLVALKMLGKPSAASEVSQRVLIDDRSEELKIHTLIGNHPNIVNLLDSFETATQSCLVLEYCAQGDLYEAIRQDKGPKETEHVRSFMHQLISAIEHLHSKGISHRDIKPENIFLTESGDMKIGDFGLATTDTWNYEIAVGSDRYMAPEQFDPQGYGLSPQRADIWSLGICLLNILFSRNPFGEPAPSDPLFDDFCKDKETLYDVFPSMSRDTFTVLSHSLCLDPEKRSLTRLREALDAAVEFTSDDAGLDEFCTEDREIVTATADREPLRTPSVKSPQTEAGQPFPWARLLQTTPQKPQSNLFNVQVVGSYTEELFPGSASSMHASSSKTETQSIESAASQVDSGLGVSIESTDKKGMASILPAARSKPVAIAGSLPAFGGRASRALSFFGMKKPFESKSWSDLYDEELEERQDQEREAEITSGHQATHLGQADVESDGRSTPRAPLASNPSAQVARPPSRTSVKSKDDPISQQTGFIFEEHTPTPGTPTGMTPKARYSPPGKRTFLDKWSVLGDRRRAVAATVREASPFDSGRSRFSPSTWRRNKESQRQNQRLDHSIWRNQAWNLSTDWRRSDQHLPRGSPLHLSQLDGVEDDDGDFEHTGEHTDGAGSPQWVGGWREDLLL